MRAGRQDVRSKQAHCLKGGTAPHNCDTLPSQNWNVPVLITAGGNSTRRRRKYIVWML